MILLGLLLMAACVAVTVDALVQNTQVMHAVLFDQSVNRLTLGGIFIAGAVIGIVFALGLLLLVGGFGRARRRRRERVIARRNSAAEADELRAHNERLERELDAKRASESSSAGATAAYPADPIERSATTATTPGSGETAAGPRHRAP